MRSHSFVVTSRHTYRSCCVVISILYLRVRLPRRNPKKLFLRCMGSYTINENFCLQRITSHCFVKRINRTRPEFHGACVHFWIATKEGLPPMKTKGNKPLPTSTFLHGGSPLVLDMILIYLLDASRFILCVGFCVAATINILFRSPTRPAETNWGKQAT